MLLRRNYDLVIQGAIIASPLFYAMTGKKPMPPVEADSNLLNTSFMNGLIRYMQNKPENNFQEYPFANILKILPNKSRPLPEAEEEKPLAPKTEKRRNRITFSPPEELSTTQPLMQCDEEKFKDIDDVRKGFYFELKNGKYAHLNRSDMLELHPTKKHNTNVEELIDHLIQKIKDERLISPPDKDEQKSKKSPFQGMQGKVRASIFGDKYRLALQIRAASSEEQKLGLTTNEVFTPKRIVQHGRGY